MSNVCTCRPNACTEQFQRKYFFFDCDDDEKEKFYKSQWTDEPLAYLIYRIFMCVYVFGSWLAFYIYNGIHYPAFLSTRYQYLTSWGRFLNTLYFILALALSIVGFLKSRDKQSEQSSDRDLAGGTEARPDQEGKAVKYLRCTTWIIHSIAQSAAICITILSSAGISIYLSGAEVNELWNNYFYVDRHAINSVLFLFEIFSVAFPMRFFHFIHPMAFGIAYVVMTLILHGAGVTSAVYPILDWANNPGLAAGVSVGAILSPVIIHSVFFGLYCLRICISAKYGNNRISLTTSVHEDDCRVHL